MLTRLTPPSLLKGKRLAARKQLSSAITVQCLLLSAIALLIVMVPLLIEASGGNNTPAPQNPVTAQNGISPRYAVIDLGAGNVPAALNNSNMVVFNGYDSSGNSYVYRWTNGMTNQLQPSSSSTTGNMAFDMDDAGDVVGMTFTGLSVYGVNEEGDYWPAGATACFPFPDGAGPPFSYFGATAYVIDSSSGVMYGEASFRDVPPPGIERPGGDGCMWSSPTTGLTRLGTFRDIIELHDEVYSGIEKVISKAKNGHTLGYQTDYTVVNHYPGVTTFSVDGTLVSYKPLALNSLGNTLGCPFNNQSPFSSVQPPVTLYSSTNQDVVPSFDVTQTQTADLNQAIRYQTNSSGTSTPVQCPQILNGNQIIQKNPNTGLYEAAKLDNLIPANSGFGGTVGTHINDSGAIVGTATYSGSNPNIAAGSHGIMLLPAELSVDANRDGNLVMANNNPSGAAVDTTSQTHPYRFWLNNDDDSGDAGASAAYGSDNVPVSQVGYTSTYISSARDLEDWTRLWIYTKGLNKAIHDGTIKVGLKWAQVSSGTPGIELVTASDADGGLEYLQDGSLTAAVVQSSPDPNDPRNISGAPVRLLLADANTSVTNVVPSGNAADFVFPQWVWTNLTDTAPTSHFLFEGSSKGMGQLEIVFLKADGTTLLGMGGSVWIDLHDIKELYQREKAQPDTIAAPYSSGSDNPPAINMTPADDTGSYTFSPDPDETKDYFIFVHGWNMSYLGSTNYSETMFKRLWWRGYKGRFAAFRWPTYYSNFPVFDPYGSAAIEASLARYNDSEYIGWESGQALAQYVNSLPSGYTRHLASHSMGAIVAASAFQQSTPISVAYYSALHAAIPAYCYDTTTTALEDAYTTAGYVTPDHDSDPATSSLAYRGRVTTVSGATVTSFYDANDSALQSWESNNHLTKPQPLYAYLSGYYFYAPTSPNGQKLGLQFILETGRYMTDKYESMAYADKSLTKTLGADGRTAGLIGSGVDMNARYSFDTEHSAEFGRPLPQVQTYYYDLMSHLGLSENYLDSGHPAISP